MVQAKAGRDRHAHIPVLTFVCYDQECQLFSAVSIVIYLIQSFFDLDLVSGNNLRIVARG